jgi:hypothetical protein
LLIISPFEKNVNRVSAQTAAIRNKMMIEMAERITIGYASKGGALEKLLNTAKKTFNCMIVSG